MRRGFSFGSEDRLRLPTWKRSIRQDAAVGTKAVFCKDIMVWSPLVCSGCAVHPVRFLACVARLILFGGGGTSFHTDATGGEALGLPLRQAPPAEAGTPVPSLATALSSSPPSPQAAVADWHHITISCPTGRFHPVLSYPAPEQRGQAAVRLRTGASRLDEGPAVLSLCRVAWQ